MGRQSPIGEMSMCAHTDRMLLPLQPLPMYPGAVLEPHRGRAWCCNACHCLPLAPCASLPAKGRGRPPWQLDTAGLPRRTAISGLVCNIRIRALCSSPWRTPQSDWPPQRRRSASITSITYSRALCSDLKFWRAAARAHGPGQSGGTAYTAQLLNRLSGGRKYTREQ